MIHSFCRSHELPCTRLPLFEREVIATLPGTSLPSLNLFCQVIVLADCFSQLSWSPSLRLGVFEVVLFAWVGSKVEECALPSLLPIPLGEVVAVVEVDLWVAHPTPGPLTFVFPGSQWPCGVPCFSGCSMSCRSSHVIKLKLSSQLIGQFGHVTASASCKQPEKHGRIKVGNPQSHHDNDLQPSGISVWSVAQRLASDC